MPPAQHVSSTRICCPSLCLCLCCAAPLQGNRLFVRTAVSTPLPCVEFYWAVFRPELAQVWVDNLADLYGNINLVSADLLSRCV